MKINRVEEFKVNPTSSSVKTSQDIKQTSEKLVSIRIHKHRLSGRRHHKKR